MFDNFQLAQPVWLWGLLLIPLIWLIVFLLRNKAISSDTSRFESFADRHLLPHLLIGKEINTQKKFLPLIILSLILLLGVFAMAGPRWGYHDIEIFKSNTSMVILLDLSKSMDVEDVKPSRIVRAREEITDILSKAENINIGLITFAASPHMIAPLTDDIKTLENLLPSLSNDLVHIPGSSVVPAIEMGVNLLKNHPGQDKYMLVISDGGFEDAEQFNKINASGQGIKIFTMGIGTKEGAPIPDGPNGWIKDNDKIIISKLEANNLQNLAQKGGGFYVEANYLENDSNRILNSIKQNHDVISPNKGKIRQWEERFYIPLFIMAFLLLIFTRKNGFIMVLILFMIPNSANARDFFKNHAQESADLFNKAMSQYQAGNYAEAEKSFAEVNGREDWENAMYNLGNSQLKQMKAQDAINTYEKVLKQNPENAETKHNLEIAKKLLKQQQNKQSKQNQQNQEDQQSSQEDNKQKQQNNQSEDNKSNQKNSEQQKKPEQKDSKPQSSENEKQKEQDKKDSESENKQNNDNEEQNGKKQDMDAKQMEAPRSQKDINADRWLNRIENNPQIILKNQFYIEDKQQNVKEGKNKW